MSLYIFLLYYIYHLCFTCIDFYDLSAWTGCWFDIYIRRFIYKFLNVCPFDYTAVAGSGKVGPINQVNHTSWVAVVTPTDRPKSVRNRCLIDLFCGVVCVFTLPFWHFRGCRGLCHRTESDLLLFLSSPNHVVNYDLYAVSQKWRHLEVSVIYVGFPLGFASEIKQMFIFLLHNDCGLTSDYCRLTGVVCRVTDPTYPRT